MDAFVICTKLDSECDIIEIQFAGEEIAHRRVTQLREDNPNQEFWCSRAPVKIALSDVDHAYSVVTPMEEPPQLSEEAKRWRELNSAGRE